MTSFAAVINAANRSMNYLSVENLSKHFGDKTLFENLSFGLAKGDKTALIAPNGAGKTTLMRMLALKEDSDEGIISKATGIRTGFLEQQPVFDEQLTINELINGSHTQVLQAIRDYEAALEKQTGHFSEQNQRELEEASARMDFMKGWDYERRLKQLLDRFAIYTHDQQIGTLSGGQRKRLALALVLLDEPDLLLLDEPTNHLDIDMIEWLEGYLRQANITFLMVTHDRYFLDRVCNNIFELSFGHLYHHKGNFTFYLQKSQEREETLRIEAAKAGQLLKKELDWMRRMPKARTTKSKSRIDAFYELKERASQKRNQQQISLGFSMNRLGSKILELQQVNKKFGDTTILDDVDFMFNKGERYGVIGKNGVGKSTFLNLISGKIPPDSGKIISGDTVVYGYFTQESFSVDENKKVIDVVREIAEVIPMGGNQTATASQLLHRFMFPAPMHHQPVSLLSGGEKRRLFLLTVLVKNPNFLILDEPTNDLDISTLQTIETYLQEYKGCLILVSHDRYFMDQVVDQLLVFEGDGKVRGFVGNYTDYREYVVEQEKEKAIELAAEAAENETHSIKEVAVKKKRSYKEQKEYEQLELEIHTFEQEKAALEVAMNSGMTDYILLEKHAARIRELIKLIDAKTMRWLELDEIGNTH